MVLKVVVDVVVVTKNCLPSGLLERSESKINTVECCKYTHRSFTSSISSPKMAWIKMTNIYNLWFFMIIPQVNDK